MELEKIREQVLEKLNQEVKEKYSALDTSIKKIENVLLTFKEKLSESMKQTIMKEMDNKLDTWKTEMMTEIKVLIKSAIVSVLLKI